MFSSGGNMKPVSRRTLMQAGAAIAGIGAARRVAAETLAIDGGTKAIAIPPARQSAISKWPRYGEEEKRAVLDMLESNKFYEEIPLLEREMKEHLGAPYVKAHINGTSALM